MTSEPSQHDVVAERRVLLRQLLKSLQQYGRTILLPVGCSDFEDWLLDKLEVEALLECVSAGGELDLMACCRSQATRSVSQGGSRRGSLLARSTLASPRTPDPKAEVSSKPSEPGHSAGAGSGADPGTRDLVLSIHDVTLDLDEGQLKDLAYETFLAAAGQHASPALLRVLRGQLDVSEARSAELEAVGALVQGAGPAASVGSLEGPAHLLRVVRPGSFGSFRSFVRWRRTAAATLWCVLRQAVTERWRGGESESARALLARLAGALRRADVSDAEEYDEAEYGEAAEALWTAAAAVAGRCATGWRFSWLLCASVADRLLRGTFDALSEAEYVTESDELVALLRRHVWPALGVGPHLHLAIYAWVHFRQFTLSGEGRLLDGACAIVKALRKAQAGAGAGAGAGTGAVAAEDKGASDVGVANDDADAGVVAANDIKGGAAACVASDEPPPETQVLECLAAAVQDLLRDYHGMVGSQTALARLLALAQAVARARGRGGDLPRAVSEAVRASASAEAARRVRATCGAFGAAPPDARAAAVLATSATELLRTELRAYSPLLLPVEPRARCVAARAVHDVVGASLLPWMASLSTLDRATLGALRAGLALEAGLVREMREDPPPAPWDLQARVDPLLYTWVDAQGGMLRSWVARIVAGEDWQPHGRQPRRGARSTTEAVQAARETMEGLFDLGVEPLPSGVVRCMADGVDAALADYARGVTASLPSVAGLRPPRPPLTRYKREVVAAAEEAEAADGRAGVEGSVSWLPALGRAEAEGIMAQSFDALLLRASAAAALEQALDELERLVMDRWQEAVRQGVAAGLAASPEGGSSADAGAAPGAGMPPSSRRGGTPTAGHYDVTGLDWATGMFRGARTAAVAARTAAVHALSERLVFGELRVALFERLYRFHARAARLGPALGEVDRVLGVLCSQAAEALPPLLARATCSALLDALEMVLLDGGPLRLFLPDDVGVLEEDLAALQALFHADADGLELYEVEAASERVAAVLDVMALDTPTLIANYKQATAMPSRPLTAARRGGGATAAAVMDADVLLRVLCHRAEHASSKFLKTLKINKRLPLGVAGQAGEALRQASETIKHVKAKTSPGLLRSLTGGRQSNNSAPTQGNSTVAALLSRKR